MAANFDGMEKMEQSDNEEIDNVTHQKLINSILTLDGKKIKKKDVELRSSDISNNLDMAIHASKDGLKIQAGDLKLKRKHAPVTLKKPLNSLDTEKAKRKIVRETVLAEMDKWQPVVNEIRSASQTVFSNRPHGLQMFHAMQPKSFIPRTPLELEIYAALGKDECLVKPNQLLTAAETKALKAMSIKEAKARRAELMKHHELLSRMEMKYKRQKKIKSKRYRKFLQKERVATEKKELEHLQKNDPEAFLQKMEVIEKNRMEERLTLKHKGGGKFSRLHKAYSKFDDKSREAIQAMLDKSRELTKKLNPLSDDDEEDDDNNSTANMAVEEVINVDDKLVHAIVKGDVSKFKARTNVWLDVPQQLKLDLAASVNSEAAVELRSIDVGRQQEQNTSDISIKSSDFIKKNSSDSSVHLINTYSTETVNESCEKSVIQRSPVKNDKCFNINTSDKLAFPKVNKTCETSNQKSVKNAKSLTVNVSDKVSDLKHNIAVNKEKKETPKPVTILESTDSMSNDCDILKVTMEELFEDEDVMEEFSKEKADIEGRSEIKLESKLPGWGSWAGPDYKGIQEKKRSKKRGMNAAKKSKKDYQPYVWVNPNKDQGIRKLLPKSVPFPFTSVQQYEMSLCQPLSRGLVPETATKLLTKPEVVTKLGHIITPLNKEDYFNKEDIDMESDIKIIEFRK